MFRIVYDSCTKSSLVEWTFYETANGRHHYLLTAGIDTRNHRCCGGELYYNLEKYLLNYVRNLYQV